MRKIFQSTFKRFNVTVRVRKWNSEIRIYGQRHGDVPEPACHGERVCW